MFNNSTEGIEIQFKQGATNYESSVIKALTWNYELVLHLYRNTLLCALQRRFKPHSCGGSDLRDQVVATRVSNPGQGVILAQEPHVHRALAVASGSPRSSKLCLKFEVAVHGPTMFLGEEGHQPVMSLSFLVRQLRTAPDSSICPDSVCAAFPWLRLYCGKLYLSVLSAFLRCQSFLSLSDNLCYFMNLNPVP